MTQNFLFQEQLFVDREKKLRGFDKLLRPETVQAVMLIEAEEKMGKSWLTAKMHQSFVLRYEGMPAVYIDFENPLDRAKITDHLAFIRMLRDRIGFVDYFAGLNEVINTVTLNQSSNQVSNPLATLAQAIQSSYSRARLEEMARFLNVDWENLEGTTLFTLTFSLVRDLHQRNELDALFERLREDRSHINWAPYQEDIVNAQESSSADLNARGGVDRGRALVLSSPQDRAYAEERINEAFFAALAELLEDKDYLVFLFDTIDVAPSEVQRFVETQLIPHLLDERLKNMVIVITGRSIAGLNEAHLRHLLVRTGLDPFTEDHVRDFMTVRQIQEAPPDFTWKGVLRLSGGIPGELALMADRLTASSSQDDPFFDD